MEKNENIFKGKKESRAEICTKGRNDSRRASSCRSGSGEACDNDVFDVYCNRWMKMNTYRTKPSTLAKYSNILDLHIRPWFGQWFLQEITTECILVFTNHLLSKKSLSPKTVHDILVVLNSVMRYAARTQNVSLQNVEFVYPREKKEEIRVLSLTEQNLLIRYLKRDMDPCKFGVLLALMTGLRLGELCALQWHNISIEEQIIRVRATMQRIKNMNPESKSAAKTKILIDSPKSDTSIRTIPLLASLIPICRTMDPHCGNAYVLTGKKQYMEPRTLQNWFQRYIKECGLKNVHFHTLRHTFATRCVEVGFEIKSLSEILGHSSASVTMNRYVHTSLALKRSNIEKLSVIDL